MMLKKIYLIISISLIGIVAYSQSTVEGKFFELDASFQNGTIHYVARDYIKLKAPFNYAAEDISTFGASINDRIIFDVDYQSDINATGRTIDHTLPVGTINGSYAISPTGAASYNIPILTPPGTGGMQPSLSIFYNSQGGNGTLGIGWDMSGLSAITRTSKTQEIDGEIGSVNLNGDDRFALDGNRLILTNGVYGTSGSQYHTEEEDFSLITSYNAAGTGPQYFKVIAKNGSIIEYGNSLDSRIETNIVGKSEIFVWLINKITDINGNYMTFTYHKDALTKEFYIERIDYTGNDLSSPVLSTYNSVQFFYEKRTDVNEIYVAEASFNSTYIMNKIKTYIGNDIVKEYEFKYSRINTTLTKDLYSRLTEIIETGNDGSKLNSTIVQWNTESNNEAIPSFTVVNSSEIEYACTYGDFNGDGLDDYIKYIKNPETGAINFVNMFLNNNGIFSPNPSKQTSYTQSVSVASVGDFNGDGKDDFLTLIPWLEGNYQLVFNSYNTDATPQLTSYPIQGSVCNTLGDILTGDFNGDGKTDIFINRFVENIGINSIGFGSETTISMLPTLSSPPQFNNPDKICVINFDGDAKSDLMVINYGVCMILEWIPDGPSGNFSPIYANSYPLAENTYLGDFNGDGKTDVLTYNSMLGWLVYFSDGINYEIASPNLLEAIPLLPPAFLANLILSDFNGDGKSDIMEISNGSDPFNKKNIRIFNSLGNNEHNLSFSNELYTYPGTPDFSINISNGIGSEYLSVADFNGDGQSDLIALDGDWLKIASRYSFHSKNQRNLVKIISNGFANNIEFEYAKNTDNTVCTNNFCRLNLDLVKTVKINNGLGSVNNIICSYDSPTFSTEVRRFLGFASTSTLDQSSNIQQINTFDFSLLSDDGLKTVYKSFPKQNIIRHTIDGIYSNTIYTNQVHFLDNYRHFAYIDNVVVDDYIKGTHIVNENTYNATDLANGNITKTKTIFGTDDYEEKEFIYAPKVLGEPTKISSEISRKKIPTDALHTTSVDHTYTPNGLLETTRTFPGLDKSLLTTYVYDDFGNVISTTISASDLTFPRTVSIEFEKPNYIFPIKTTKALESGFDLIEEKKYDYRNGAVLSSKDLNGLETKYIYDGFGRLKETILPTKVKITNTISWNEDASFTQAIFTNSTFIDDLNLQGDEVTTNTDYFDILGRKIKATSLSFDNRQLVSNTTYNAKGQTYQVSEPFFNGETEKFVTYSYRNDGRINTIESEPATITHSYSGLTSTVTNSNSGESTTKTYSANGLLQSVTTNTGTVDYEYFSSGQPKSVTTLGNVVSMTYNPYGQQETLTDPDAGTMTYTYFSTGELETQTDKRGNMFSMTYDNAGRILTKTCGDYNLIYEYDDKPNGIGLVSFIEASSKTKQDFEYDEFSRVKKMTEIIDLGLTTQQNLISSYSYYTNGQEKSVTYPSGLVVTNIYDKVGTLIKKYRSDSGSSEIIWELGNLNSRGQILNFKKKNATYVTTNTYDDIYGYLESSLTPNYSKFQYDFDDATGNLNFRKDLLHNNLKEIFTYDTDYNRLLTAKDEANSVYDTEIEYADNGNILLKDNLGDYAYEATQPHAVTRILNEDVVKSERQVINYNCFNSVSDISNIDNNITNKNIVFTYGVDDQRRKTVYTSGTYSKTKYYSSSFEKIIINNNGVISTKELTYIPAPSGLAAIFVKEGTSNKMYYAFTDYLGSIQTIVDETGVIVQESRYDAWGKRVYNSFTTPSTTELITDRGFTGHEHLADDFQLINMNGRLYDPTLARMLSPDNFVPSPFNTQDFNRYSYARNNPLKFTDPNGEFPWLLVFAFVYFTQPGYEIQKVVSPIALHGDIHLSPRNIGVGFDVSVGVPKFYPLSYRAHYGTTYYWKTISGESVWETRQGGEWSLNVGLGFVYNITYSGTTFGGINAQTTNTISLGGPLKKVSYENDTEMFFSNLPGVPGFDGGDRYRTAAVRINSWPFQIGMNLHTGMASGAPNEAHPVGGFDNIGSGTKDDPDRFDGGTIADKNFTSGILYLGFGPIRLGMDSEGIRHIFQNRIAHDKFFISNYGRSYWWVNRIPDKKPQIYWYFGSGTGDSSW